MSLFLQNKLFLNPNFNDVIIEDTPRRLTFTDVILDRSVIQDKNLSFIRIVFVKNETSQSLDFENFENLQNTYFKDKLKLNTSELDLNDGILSNISSDFNDYEKNKILNYSNIPSRTISFDHIFKNSDADFDDPDTDLNKLSYDLDFISPYEQLYTFWAVLSRGFYVHNMDEEYKYFLVAYDDKQNIIDSTNIMKLEGYTARTQITVEYNELINTFKSEVLRANTFLEVTDSGFKIKNYVPFTLDNGSIRRYVQKPVYEPVINNPDLSYDRNQHVVLYNTYPSLNATFIKHAIEENTARFDGVILDGSLRSPWVFGGNVNTIDENGEAVPFTSDGILDRDELQRYQITRVRDANVILKYFCARLGQEFYFNIQSNNTWENNYDISIGENLNFINAFLVDYRILNTFKFKVEIQYHIRSYNTSFIPDENFTLTTEHDLQKSELRDLVSFLSNQALIRELERDYSFDLIVTPRVGDELIQLNITKKNNNQESIFEANGRPLLSRLTQRKFSRGNVTIDETIDKIYLNQDLDENKFRNVGSNTFLHTISSTNTTSWFFNLKGRTISERTDDIVLTISANYLGTPLEFTYSLDIPGSIYLNRSTFSSNFLAENNLFDITFNIDDTLSSNQINFNIEFDKDKMDELSQQLLFGNTAIASNINDTNSPVFLEKLIHQFKHVDHIFFIEISGREMPISIFFRKTGLNNVKFSKDRYIEVEADSKYYVNNVINQNSPFNLTSVDKVDVSAATVISLIGNSNIFAPQNEAELTYCRDVINAILSGETSRIADMTFIQSAGYGIKVTYRNFCMPKGLNEDYSNETRLQLEQLNYTNINQYNTLITDDIKFGLYNYVFEQTPTTSRNQLQLLTSQWLSKNFLNDSTRHSGRYQTVVTNFTDYFLGQEGGYITRTSQTIGVSKEDLYQVRDQVKNYIESDYNKTYADYNLLINKNISLKLTTDTNCRLHFSTSRASTSPGGYDPGKTGLRFGNFLVGQQKTRFSIIIDSRLSTIWNIDDITNIQAVFIPEIITINNKYRDYTHRDWFYQDPDYPVSINKEHLQVGFAPGSDNNSVVKLPYVDNCTYSISSENEKQLDVFIDTTPVKGQGFPSFDFNHYLSSYTKDCLLLDNDLNTDNLKNYAVSSHNNYRTRYSYKSSTLLEKTFIVKNFYYRIKIEFVNQKVLYVNIPIDTITFPSHIENKIKTDLLRSESIITYKANYLRETLTNNKINKIRSGNHPELFYNLAFMPIRIVKKGTPSDSRETSKKESSKKTVDDKKDAPKEVSTSGRQRPPAFDINSKDLVAYGPVEFLKLPGYLVGQG